MRGSNIIRGKTKSGKHLAAVPLQGLGNVAAWLSVSYKTTLVVSG
jgi:hypothetical protein